MGIGAHVLAFASVAVENPATSLLHLVTRPIPMRFTGKTAGNSYGFVRMQLVARPRVRDETWLAASRNLLHATPRLIRNADAASLSGVIAASAAHIEVPLDEVMTEWVRIVAILGVIDRLRPILRAGGMNVELIDYQSNNARVRLTGLDARCPSAPLALQSCLEEALRHEIRDFGELRLVIE
jgi:Fe-S cluster biogenesis protein NfuA